MSKKVASRWVRYKKQLVNIDMIVQVRTEFLPWETSGRIWIIELANGEEIREAQNRAEVEPILNALEIDYESIV